MVQRQLPNPAELLELMKFKKPELDGRKRRLDAALTIEFGSVIDPALLAAVNALDAAIGRLQQAGALPGVIETMPTFRSLTVFFDPLGLKPAPADARCGGSDLVLRFERNALRF